MLSHCGLILGWVRGFSRLFGGLRRERFKKQAANARLLLQTCADPACGIADEEVGYLGHLLYLLWRPVRAECSGVLAVGSRAGHPLLPPGRARRLFSPAAWGAAGSSSCKKDRTVRRRTGGIMAERCRFVSCREGERD